MIRVDNAAEQIKSEFQAQRADLVSLMQRAMNETIFTSRATLRPSSLARVAAEEVDALLSFMPRCIPSIPQQRGRQLCDIGVGQESLLRMAQRGRQFCLERLEPFVLGPALDTLDSYFNNEIRAYNERREDVMLHEQERIRSALQRSVGQYTVQMQLATDIAQATTSILDLNLLLQTAADLIRKSYNLYYVGIFLLDDYRQWAILRAGAGESEKVVVERGYRLALTEEGPIVSAVKSSLPRIVHRTPGQEGAFNFPTLPDIESEIVAPLLLRGEVIGVVAALSNQVSAFTQRDLDGLSVIAHQLSNAIENANLFARAQENLREAEAARRSILPAHGGDGAGRESAFLYELHTDSFHPVESWPATPPTASDSGVTLAAPVPTARPGLAVPLVLRDETVGTIELYDAAETHAWSEDEVSLANAVASQAALALENARLYAAAQQELGERKRAELALRRRNEELGALNRVTSEATRFLDTQLLMTTTTRDLVDLFHIRSCGIALLNPERTALQVVANSARDANVPTRTGLVIPIAGNPASTEVIETGKVAIISDMASDPMVDNLRDVMRPDVIQCMMVVPIKIRDEVIGTIGLEDDTPGRKFSPEEAALAETIAAQIASALANARLFEQVQTHATELEATKAEIEASLKEKEILLKEIHHRVKNNLQVVSSLLNLEAGRVQDKTFVMILKESQARIRSMALIHEKLYQSKDLSRVDFDGYVRNLTAYLFRTYKASAGTIELKIEVEEVLLAIDRAIPCGLILNELITNSLKYAFADGRAGEIRVILRPIEGDLLMLRVQDNGVGLPADLDIENTESLGMQLVNTLTTQLGGKLTVASEHGACFTITFPR